MKEKKKIYAFTGRPLKAYLNKNSKSYVVAARELSIDKNTVGKLVRGGNVNVDILLRVCNSYGLAVSEFFNVVSQDGSDVIFTTDCMSCDDGMTSQTRLMSSVRDCNKLHDILSSHIRIERLLAKLCVMCEDRNGV